MDKCWFCPAGKRHIEVYVTCIDMLVPICYRCNRLGKHLEYDWSYRLNDQWTYYPAIDTFKADDGLEIGRPMLSLYLKAL